MLAVLGRELEPGRPGAPAEFDAVLDEGKIDDDLLRLMFISCHPVLSTEARIALTLRLLGGLTTEEIARGFLAAEPTIAKRIVRPNRRWPAGKSRSRCRRRPNAPPGWPRSSKCCTWCSTRATRRWPATTGCAPRCAPRRCVSAACWPA